MTNPPPPRRNHRQNVHGREPSSSFAASLSIRPPSSGLQSRAPAPPAQPLLRGHLSSGHAVRRMGYEDIDALIQGLANEGNKYKALGQLEIHLRNYQQDFADFAKHGIDIQNRLSEYRERFLEDADTALVSRYDYVFGEFQESLAPIVKDYNDKLLRKQRALDALKRQREPHVERATLLGDFFTDRWTGSNGAAFWGSLKPLLEPSAHYTLRDVVCAINESLIAENKMHVRHGQPARNAAMLQLKEARKQLPTHGAQGPVFKPLLAADIRAARVRFDPCGILVPGEYAADEVITWPHCAKEGRDGLHIATAGQLSIEGAEGLQGEALDRLEVLHRQQELDLAQSGSKRKNAAVSEGEESSGTPSKKCKSAHAAEENEEGDNAEENGVEEVEEVEEDIEKDDEEIEDVEKDIEKDDEELEDVEEDIQKDDEELEDAEEDTEKHDEAIEDVEKEIDKDDNATAGKSGDPRAEPLVVLSPPRPPTRLEGSIPDRDAPSSGLRGCHCSVDSRFGKSQSELAGTINNWTRLPTTVQDELLTYLLRTLEDLQIPAPCQTHLALLARELCLRAAGDEDEILDRIGVVAKVLLSDECQASREEVEQGMWVSESTRHLFDRTQPRISDFLAEERARPEPSLASVLGPVPGHEEGVAIISDMTSELFSAPELLCDELEVMFSRQQAQDRIDGYVDKSYFCLANQALSVLPRAWQIVHRLSRGRDVRFISTPLPVIRLAAGECQFVLETDPYDGGSDRDQVWCMMVLLDGEPRDVTFMIRDGPGSQEGPNRDGSGPAREGSEVRMLTIRLRVGEAYFYRPGTYVYMENGADRHAAAVAANIVPINPLESSAGPGEKDIDQSPTTKVRYLLNVLFWTPPSAGGKMTPTVQGALAHNRDAWENQTLLGDHGKEFPTTVRVEFPDAMAAWLHGTQYDDEMQKAFLAYELGIWINWEDEGGPGARAWKDWCSTTRDLLAKYATFVRSLNKKTWGIPDPISAGGSTQGTIKTIVEGITVSRKALKSRTRVSAVPQPRPGEPGTPTPVPHRYLLTPSRSRTGEVSSSSSVSASSSPSVRSDPFRSLPFGKYQDAYKSTGLEKFVETHDENGSEIDADISDGEVAEDEV